MVLNGIFVDFLPIFLVLFELFFCFYILLYSQSSKNLQKKYPSDGLTAGAGSNGPCSLALGKSAWIRGIQGLPFRWPVVNCRGHAQFLPVDKQSVDEIFWLGWIGGFIYTLPCLYSWLKVAWSKSCLIDTYRRTLFKYLRMSRSLFSLLIFVGFQLNTGPKKKKITRKERGLYSEKNTLPITHSSRSLSWASKPWQKCHA